MEDKGGQRLDLHTAAQGDMPCLAGALASGNAIPTGQRCVLAAGQTPGLRHRRLKTVTAPPIWPHSRATPVLLGVTTLQCPLELQHY